MKNILSAALLTVALAIVAQAPAANAASIGLTTDNVLTERAPAKYCTASSQCNVALGHFCDHNRCRKRRPNGSGCYKDVGCISGLCWKERGTCISAVKPRPLQAPCTASVQCDSKYCGYSRCAKKVKNGKKCYKDAGCRSGKCDKAQQKCVPVTLPTSTIAPDTTQAPATSDVFTSTDEAPTPTASTTAVEEPTTTAEPSSAEPTSVEPTSAQLTSAESTSAEPTSAEFTSAEPTSAEPTSAESTSPEPTSAEPTSAEPTTLELTTTAEPTTVSTSEPEEPTTVITTAEPEPTTVITITDPEPTTALTTADPEPTTTSAEATTTDSTTEVLPTSTIEAITTEQPTLEPTTTTPVETETVAPTTSAQDPPVEPNTTAEATTTAATEEPVTTTEVTTTAEATTTEEPTTTTATEQPTTTAAPETTTTAEPTTTDQSRPLSTSVVVATTNMPAAPEATVNLVANGDFSFLFPGSDLVPFFETVSDPGVGGSATVAQINDHQRAADLRVFNDGNTVGIVYSGQLLGKRALPGPPTATTETVTTEPTTTTSTGDVTTTSEAATATEAATTTLDAATTTQDAQTTATATTESETSRTSVTEGSIGDNLDPRGTRGYRYVRPSVTDADNAWKYALSYDWLFYNGTGPVDTGFGSQCTMQTAIGAENQLTKVSGEILYWFFYKNEALFGQNVWRPATRYFVSSVADPQFRILLACQQMSGAAYVTNIGFNERVSKYDSTTGGYIVDGGFENSYEGWTTYGLDALGQQTFEGTAIIDAQVTQPDAGQLAAMLSAHDWFTARIQQSFMLPHVDDDDASYKFSLRYKVREITASDESSYNTEPSQFSVDTSYCRLSAKLRNNLFTATVEDSREYWVQWTPSQLASGSEGSDWQTMSFSVPSNMALADVSFTCSAATAGSIFLDEVKLERDSQRN